MTLRQELQMCIDDIPESKLMALKPLLFSLADDAIVLETNLSAHEKALIAQGLAEYQSDPSSFTLLSDL